jgi:hypothetical protein
MSFFYEKAQQIESVAKSFEQIAFCSWKQKKVIIPEEISEILSDFEKQFITDVGMKWINGEKAPADWSRKQVALIQRIESKVKNKELARVAK